MFFQLGDDGGFVRVGEGGGVEDGREFDVGFKDLVERGEGSGDGVEGGGFGGGGVLEEYCISRVIVLFIMWFVVHIGGGGWNAMQLKST